MAEFTQYNYVVESVLSFYTCSIIIKHFGFKIFSSASIMESIFIFTCCLLLLSNKSPSLRDANWASRSAGMVFFKLRCL